MKTKFEILEKHLDALETEIDNEILDLAHESIAQAYTAKTLGFLDNKENIDRHTTVLNDMLGNDEDLNSAIKIAIEYIQL